MPINIACGIEKRNAGEIDNRKGVREREREGREAKREKERKRMR